MKLYFDEKLNEKGIKVSYKDYDITMKPFEKATDKIVANKAFVNAEENSITYDKAFGENTSLVLYSTLEGFKEDIVLYEPTEQNEFEFIVDFGNLIPKQEAQGILLQDKKGSTILQVPPIYVEDSNSDGKINSTTDNKMKLEQIEDGIYKLTITANKIFLMDENTVYPVKVDPSIIIPNSGNGASVTVDSSAPNTNFVSNTDNWVNQWKSYNGKDLFSQVYIKFSLSSISTIPYDNIISSYYHCNLKYSNSKVGVSTIDCYMVSDQTNWNASEITWNNKPNVWSDPLTGEPQKLCKINVSVNNHNAGYDLFDFYITMAVQAWRQGVDNGGIMLAARTCSSSTYFASERDNIIPYRPCLIVTYVNNVDTNEASPEEGYGVNNNTKYRLRNKQTGTYLTANNTSNYANPTLQAYNGTNNQVWKTYFTNNGYCKLIPMNAQTKCLEMNTINTLNSDTSQEWKLVRNWDGSYKITSRYVGSQRGLIFSEQSNVIQISTTTTDLIKNDNWTLEPVDKGIADFYSFTNHDNYGINTTTNISTCIGLTQQMGYTTYDKLNASADVGYSRLADDNIWFFTGHGEESALHFKRINGSNLNRSYIKAYDDNSVDTYYINQFQANQLKKLQLAVYSSCLTGLDKNDSSMVGLTYKRGAHFVISHTIETNIGPDYRWMLEFYTALNDGKTVYQAMELADEYIYNYYDNLYGTLSTYGNLNQRHIMGDYDLILSH